MLEAIKNDLKYNSKIVASKIDREKIPGIDILLDTNDNFIFGNTHFNIIFVPGHTKGHIAFYSQKEKVIFTGDTLFSLGCGRIFEGTYEQMYDSLKKIKKLPKDTKIYCGHEYTASNAKIIEKYEKKNKALKIKLNWIKEKLNRGMPTIPIPIMDLGIN